MKTLTKLEINLPVYSSQSVISYQAIRKPTAFEALGLLLLDQHKNTLGQFSLAQVCQVCTQTSISFYCMSQGIHPCHGGNMRWQG